MSQKVVAQGGNGGVVWNDGLSKGVTKVQVGKDDSCVTYVKFQYVKDSTVESHEHGNISHQPQEFSVDYPNEYITSVEGTYACPATTTVITSILFKTSNGRTSPTFGNQNFVLESNGQKLVGFHGRNGLGLDALGAYFLSESTFPKRLEPQGGPGGGIWDDKVYDDIRKVYVGSDGGCVTGIMIDYVRGGIPETHAHGHGVLNEETQEFLLDPNEYITSVEGTYGKVARFGLPVITSLVFKTSTGRTSLTFGARKFVIEDINGRKIVGFHGRSEVALDAIGAHFALTPNRL
ncbi:Jacalin-related lectin 23 [Cardamine amara subsp. amara]|uniref:Jacalin-related lectin 23 n=1 Tax=Cardamine amara subsp. amara TaxID=228776 RepID=A0ABD1B5V5_CARAN